uniref:tRNA-uridine aminocarboxypropyltransferase n=1 Tax=Trichogramma kaykai TaxID=54128 RepID=A0ABD2XQY1_9HYME
MFALIYYTNAKQIDVFKDSEIKSVDGKCKVKWGNKYYNVEIFKKSDDREWLDSLDVNEEGEVITLKNRHQNQTPLLKKKKDISKEVQQEKSSKKKALKLDSELLLNKKSLFDPLFDDDDDDDEIMAQSSQNTEQAKTRIQDHKKISDEKSASDSSSEDEEVNEGKSRRKRQSSSSGSTITEDEENAETDPDDSDPVQDAERKKKPKAKTYGKSVNKTPDENVLTNENSNQKKMKNVSEDQQIDTACPTCKRPPHCICSELPNMTPDHVQKLSEVLDLVKQEHSSSIMLHLVGTKTKLLGNKIAASWLNFGRVLG